MSLNLPNSKVEIYWVKSFLTLDRFKWPDTEMQARLFEHIIEIFSSGQAKDLEQNHCLQK